MHPINRFSALAVALVAVLAVTATGSARAGAKNGDVFTDWTVECKNFPTDEGKEVAICFLAQIAASADKTPVVKVELGYQLGSGNPIAQITVPLGVVLASGLGLQIDDGKAISVPYTTCVPVGCQVAAPVEDDFVLTLKKGNTLKVSFQTINGQSLVASLSLAGITAGLDALAPE